MCWRHELSLVEDITQTKRDVRRHTWIVFLFVVGKIQCIAAIVSIIKIAEKKHHPCQQKIPGKKNPTQITTRAETRDAIEYGEVYKTISPGSFTAGSMPTSVGLGCVTQPGHCKFIESRFVYVCVYEASQTHSHLTHVVEWVLSLCQSPNLKWQNGRASIQRTVFI